MARKPREFTVFNLSFLDVMSCGFGATLLVFLILQHNSDMEARKVNEDLMSESDRLDYEVREGRANLVELRNTIAEIIEQTVIAQGRAKRIIEELKKRREELSTDDKDTLAQVEHANRLMADIQQLEEENRRLREQAEKRSGSDVRRFSGEGDRQYLTGLKLGGQRILVMIDRSASMLDHSLVNVLRMRNMSKEAQSRSAKWQNALSIVDWVSARMPPASQFQIYAFNTSAASVLTESGGKWIPVSDKGQLDKAIGNLRAQTPEGGTSLVNAFSAIAAMSPRPDNIFLITDGLPTQGAAPGGAKATGRDRQKYFNQAIDRLPDGIPVNVILLPMEGDPIAASAFWQLARVTRGTLLAPSRDWP
jgi:von Willebrand factor type A domain